MIVCAMELVFEAHVKLVRLIMYWHIVMPVHCYNCIDKLLIGYRNLRCLLICGLKVNLDVRILHHRKTKVVMTCS